MKKKTTFLKLFTLLALSCLSIGYAWADSHTICFDRHDDNKTLISIEKMPFTKEHLNTDQGPMPAGTDWTPEGNELEYSNLGDEHYWGYKTVSNKWKIKLENFKYQVTNISLFADDANTDEKEMGQLTIVPYTVVDNVENHVNKITNKANKLPLESQEFKDTYAWHGLKYIEYEQLTKYMCYFRSKPDFLEITYQDPTISYEDNAKTLGVGMTYSIDKSAISWTNQGAFTTDDIKFNTDNASVATVDANGVITATGVGTTTITAKVINTLNNTDYDVNGASFSITITVPKIYTENGKIIVAGSWTSDELNTSLSSNSVITASTTSVDLTNATITDNVAVTVPTTNPNVLIKASSNEQVTNDHNVIVNGTCNKLKIQDGDIFNNTETFTATTAEYIREKTDTWNAVCLPYAPVPTENTTYFKLISVSNNSLTFEKVDEPAANTPYLAKNTTGGNFDATRSTSVSVGVTPTTSELNGTEADGYIMRGAFNPTSVVDGTNYKDAKPGFDLITDANAYYYLNNQFHLINGRFNMLGFRAYLTKVSDATDGNAKVSSLGLCFGDDFTTGAKFIEDKDNGTVKVIFDTNGRKLNAPQKGINIINGKKVLVK